MLRAFRVLHCGERIVATGSRWTPTPSVARARGRSGRAPPTPELIPELGVTSSILSVQPFPSFYLLLGLLLR